jgi:hypothetical protein
MSWPARSRLRVQQVQFRQPTGNGSQCGSGMRVEYSCNTIHITYSIAKHDHHKQRKTQRQRKIQKTITNYFLHFKVMNTIIGGEKRTPILRYLIRITTEYLGRIVHHVPASGKKHIFPLFRPLGWV